jgi:hypothetical protein
VVQDPGQFEAALRGVNQRRCCPPLVDDEVKRIARSAGRYPPASAAVADPTRNQYPYQSTPSGLFWLKPEVAEFRAVRLTNFDARITRELVEDDGVERRRTFKVEANLTGKKKEFTVSADQFAGLTWVARDLGASAVLFPGFGTKEHARAAAQLLSGRVPISRIFTHLGWRRFRGQEVYLHGGGQLARQG